MMHSIIIAAALVSTAALPAHAQEEQRRSIHVRFNMAELRTPQARAALERRLALAARQACFLDGTMASRLPSHEELHCRAVALAKARRDVAQALLNASPDRELASAVR